METRRRVEGLVNYIADKYSNAAEIGIGHFPDVAFALLERGVKVFVTDIRPFKYHGLKVVVDDITNTDISLYKGVNLIYSLRTPPELVPYMIRLARTLSIDLIVKPLSSEYLNGRLVCHGNTTFYSWKNCHSNSICQRPINLTLSPTPPIKGGSNRDSLSLGGRGLG